MINYIKGHIKAIHEHQLSVVSSSLNMGFAISVINPLSFSINEEIELYLFMHWNQEQGPSLYGFRTVQERDLFILVNSCNGIGPKMALSILSQTDMSTFVSAIQTHDVKALSQFKGIGEKKAEQLILQLKTKIERFTNQHNVSSVGAARYLKEVSDVLQSLNYSRSEIQQAISYAREQAYESEPAFDHVMRSALSFLSKKM